MCVGNTGELSPNRHLQHRRRFAEAKADVACRREIDIVDVCWAMDINVMIGVAASSRHDDWLASWQLCAGIAL